MNHKKLLLTLTLCLCALLCMVVTASASETVFPSTVTPAASVGRHSEAERASESKIAETRFIISILSLMDSMK